MLFHITQTHTPENCPKDAGGSKTLYDPKVEGVKLLAMYGAFSQHVIYYIVEAHSLEAVHKFLDPGWKRCTATITPMAKSRLCGEEVQRRGGSYCIETQGFPIPICGLTTGCRRTWTRSRLLDWAVPARRVPAAEPDR